MGGGVRAASAGCWAPGGSSAATAIPGLQPRPRAWCALATQRLQPVSFSAGCVSRSQKGGGDSGCSSTVGAWGLGAPSKGWQIPGWGGVGASQGSRSTRVTQSWDPQRVSKTLGLNRGRRRLRRRQNPEWKPPPGGSVPSLCHPIPPARPCLCFKMETEAQERGGTSPRSHQGDWTEPQASFHQFFPPPQPRPAWEGGWGGRGLAI